MPNVTSETLETEQKIGAAGRGNTMDLKYELVPSTNPTKKVPNVTSETLETEQKIGAAGRGNTMALKDELVRESHQKSA